ncbi:MAG: cupin domain-containing protein [Jatrophihabitans sp.]
MIKNISLETTAREQLDSARNHASARSALTVFGGHEHAMRQTVVALAAGAALSDHENPGEATLHVLHGHVQLTAGDEVGEGRQGDFLVIPDQRHGVRAIEDSVVLLTAVPRSHIS